MALPPRFRTAVSIQFPTIVTALAPAYITRLNGIWTISLSYGYVATIPDQSDGSINYVLAWSSATQSFYRVPLSQIAYFQKAKTVANLPAAASVPMGARDFVTDATATTFGSIVAGGGANKVPVYSDQTNWRIG